MAHVEKRGPNRWRARWRTPDGREHSVTRSTRREAQLELDKVAGDLLRGTYVDPKAGQRLFGDYFEEWRASRVHRPSTAAQVESHFRRHVLPTFEARALARITPTQVQGWVRELSDSLAPATVEVIYRHTSAVFRSAVADGLIARSPCEGVKLPKSARAKVTPLEVETVHALVDAVPDRYRALVVLAAGMGLRQGEAFGLTVENVDFPRQRLAVVQQLVTVTGRPPFLAPPKTEASIRSVPIPDVVLHELVAHVAAFPDLDEERRLVFTTPAGGPVRRNRFGETWRRAVTRAGAPAGTGFHALRHFYASLLIRHGESVKTVQARLGHASAVETLDTYGHLWPDSDDRTREAVDLVLAPAVDEAQSGAR